MVIDPNNRLPNAGSPATRNRSAAGIDQNKPGQKTQESATASDNDSVLLSSEAQAVKRLEAKINSSPAIDNARIAAVKNAIARGNFEINVERIAEKMLHQDSLF